MPLEKKIRVKKPASKKKTSAHHVKKSVSAEPPASKDLAVCEVALPAAPQHTLVSRMTVVLNRTVLVSSIAAYVIAFVLVGVSTVTLAVQSLCLPYAQAGQAVSANTDGSCPAGYSDDGNPPVAAAASAAATSSATSTGGTTVPPAVPAAGGGGTSGVAPPSGPTGGITPVGTLGANLQAAGVVAYGPGDPANIGVYIAKFILFFFGALGMMFTVYIFYAGFLWLTAAGEEDKVNKARAIIFHSIFAIAICLMAFTLSNAWLKGLADAAR